MKRILQILTMFIVTIGIYGQSAIYNTPAYMSQVAVDSALLENTTYSADTTILISNQSVLSINATGSTSMQGKGALVRIIFVDTEDMEYLVFEDFLLDSEAEIHTFSYIAFETLYLNNVNAKAIKLVVRKATLRISSINLSYDYSFTVAQRGNIQAQAQSNVSLQEEYMIDYWNDYNLTHGCYWVAGQTSISSMTYREKKTIFGIENDDFISDGLEYYKGGIFVFHDHGDIENDTIDVPQNAPANNTFVEEFDWRNRHGRNWMTSVKNQTEPFDSVYGNNGCWIFGTCAALESRLNLYYNQLLNVDVAEQEIASCSFAGQFIAIGGQPTWACEYIVDNGICLESCFPFQNSWNVSCDEKCESPSAIITANIFDCPNTISESILKRELILNGPFISGILSNSVEHVMCLCGYKTLRSGDRLDYYSDDPRVQGRIIEEGDPLIGKTCWIYKNSWGENSGYDGYLYAVHDVLSQMSYNCKFEYPIQISTLTDSDIAVTDNDHDGYYFWGLGPKPANCPTCCPDIPDGDDSNPNLAEMNRYGRFAPYIFPYDTIYVTTSTDWDVDFSECGNIVISGGIIVNLTAILTLNSAAKIFVQDGATLVVDGGTIVNSSIVVKENSTLILQNDGVLQIKKDHSKLVIEQDANFRYLKGIITVIN